MALPSQPEVCWIESILKAHISFDLQLVFDPLHLQWIIFFKGTSFNISLPFYPHLFFFNSSENLSCTKIKIQDTYVFLTNPYLHAPGASSHHIRYSRMVINRYFSTMIYQVLYSLCSIGSKNFANRLHP